LTRERRLKLIQRVMSETPFSMRQLAEEAGVGYALVRAWSIGRRAPLPEAMLKVAGVLRSRGERLMELAQEIEDAVEKEAREG
jgi:transcriptional regulator with XRE-family HTH domain